MLHTPKCLTGSDTLTLSFLCEFVFIQWKVTQLGVSKTLTYHNNLLVSNPNFMIVEGYTIARVGCKVAHNDPVRLDPDDAIEFGGNNMRYEPQLG